MAKSPIQTADSSAAPDIAANLASFARHLRAENKAPSTITTYSKAVDQLDAYLASVGMPRAVAAHPPRAHRGVPRGPPGARCPTGDRVAAVPDRLQPFFKWLASEGEIADDADGEHEAAARARSSRPRCSARTTSASCSRPAPAPSSTTAATPRSSACSSTPGCAAASWPACGWRTSTSTTTSPSSSARAVGRGPARSGARRPRRSTATSGSRGHRGDAESEWLWLGKRGRLTDTGIEQVVKRRAAEAGLVGVHPHLFRHSYAHAMLADGMAEGDLMSPRRLAQPADARPLRRVRQGRAGAGRIPHPQPRRPAVSPDERDGVARLEALIAELQGQRASMPAIYRAPATAALGFARDMVDALEAGDAEGLEMARQDYNRSPLCARKLFEVEDFLVVVEGGVRKPLRQLKDAPDEVWNPLGRGASGPADRGCVGRLDPGGWRDRRSRRRGPTAQERGLTKPGGSGLEGGTAPKTGPWRTHRSRGSFAQSWAASRRRPTATSTPARRGVPSSLASMTP